MGEYSLLLLNLVGKYSLLFLLLVGKENSLTFISKVNICPQEIAIMTYIGPLELIRMGHITSSGETLHNVEVPGVKGQVNHNVEHLRGMNKM